MNKNELAKWMRLNRYTLSEAALIIIGESPSKHTIQKIIAGESPDEFTPLVKQMIEDAQSNKTEVVWGDSDNVENVTFQSLYKLETIRGEFESVEGKSYEQWLSTEVKKDDIRKWTKQRGHAQVFDDDYLSKSTASVSSGTYNLHPNITLELSMLIEASGMFWGGAVKEEVDTHSNNEQQVVPWLESGGFSKSLARAGATIIRPPWAHKGRSPEK